MTQPVQIGAGKVDISADLSTFDAAMATLPKKAASKMDAAMQALQSKAKQTKLDLKLAYNAGDLATQQKLIPIYENLKAKITAVEEAAIRQAKAIQEAARIAHVSAAHEQAQAAARKSEAEAIAAAKRHEADGIAAVAAIQAQADREAIASAQRLNSAREAAARITPERAAANAAKVAETGAGLNAVWLDQQVIGRLNQAGAAGKKMGADVREGSGNGAMGLMLLAQTIDDAQYGFKAIVNNIPQVALAVGTAMGASTESALKFGGAMGIAAVAINTWINNWEEAKAIFSGSESEDIKEVVDQMTRLGNAARSLFATLANLDRGWNWVSTTGEESAAVAKQMEDRAAYAKQHAKDVKANRKAVEGMAGDADEKRGKQFKDAVGAYGGGDKLANAVVASRMKKFASLTGKERNAREEQIRNQVDADIVRAKGGSAEAIKALRGEDPRLKALLPKYASGAKEARTKKEHETKANVARTAGDLMDSVGRDLLKDPKMGTGKLWGKIKEAMEKAGYSVKEIVDLLPGVAEKLKTDVNNKVRDRSGKDSIDAAEARKRLLADAALSDKHKLESKPQYREAQRLANAMDSRALLRDGGISDKDLERGVRKNLKSAGMDDKKIDESAAQVAKILRKKVEEQVQERSLDKGISSGEARQQLLKEADEQANRDQPKAEIMSTESYMSKLLVGALNQSQKDSGKDQVTEQKTTNKKLDSVIKLLAKPKAGTFAVAAPGK